MYTNKQKDIKSIFNIKYLLDTFVDFQKLEKFIYI